MVKYASQRVAYPYFVIALFLFGAQIIVGLWLLANYFLTIPQGIVDVLPFSTARAIHTNLLVLWMLLGFMGGAYFMVPEEAERELFSAKTALVQLGLLVFTGLAALIGFVAGWSEGRPLLEIPTPLDVLIVLAALIFLFNLGLTMILARHWTVIQGTLLGGLVFLALLYLFDLPFYRNLALDWYYWWWIIHLWVEGAWELVAGAILAWVLLRITGVPRQLVEKWLYVEIGLFLFTGIAGTGHHYYWLGAPSYWLWIGGIFSALEPVPIILMVIDTLHYVRRRRFGRLSVAPGKQESVTPSGAEGRQLTPANPLVLTYAVGCAIYHLLGAGVWGIVHTLPQVNRFTHGSQVTVSHGHLAFFGAYALLNLTVFYFALPRLRGVERFSERRGRFSFWAMCLAMFGMGLGWGVAGVIQTYLERVLGLGYMTAQGYMRLWFAIVWAMAIVFTTGVFTTIADLLSLRPAQAPAEAAERPA